MRVWIESEATETRRMSNNGSPFAMGLVQSITLRGRGGACSAFPRHGSIRTAYQLYLASLSEHSTPASVSFPNSTTYINTVKELHVFNVGVRAVSTP